MTEFDWRTARVDRRVSWYYYECMECHHEIIVSPRWDTNVISSMYCPEHEHGPPFVKTKVEFHDGTVLDAPYNTSDQTISEYES